MTLSRFVVCAAALLATGSLARAQEEIAPPQGKGRLVMVLSGMSGPEHYHRVAEVIASQGFDVLLYDGNAIAGSHGAALKAAVAAAPGIATHALPGKIGLVGFSLGGGIALGMRPAGPTALPRSSPGIRRPAKSPTRRAGRRASARPC
jgi:dienelactone hydrolase